METWKQINNFDNYFVSDYGNVKAINKKGREYLLSITSNGNGYERVYLYREGIRTKYLIHRLVAEHFIKNSDPQTKTQVHHIDHVRDNNRILNLMWCTPKENIKFMFANKKNRTTSI